MAHQPICYILSVVVLIGFLAICVSFKPRYCKIDRTVVWSNKRNTNLQMSLDWKNVPILLAETGISDEDVLQISGTTSVLPNPLITAGVAALILIGVGILQFSLGDLTKEV